MGRLAVERRPLVGVLAIAQVVDLLEHDRETLRERRVRDLVEVGRDLGVVRGDDPERVRCELGPELGTERVMALELGEQTGIVLRAADRGHAGAVPGRRAEERRAADVDHLDRLVDRGAVRASLGAGWHPPAGAKGFPLTTTMSIAPIPCSTSSSIWAATSRRARIP